MFFRFLLTKCRVICHAGTERVLVKCAAQSGSPQVSHRKSVDFWLLQLMRKLQFAVEFVLNWSEKRQQIADKQLHSSSSLGSCAPDAAPMRMNTGLAKRFIWGTAHTTHKQFQPPIWQFRRRRGQMLVSTFPEGLPFKGCLELF